MMEEKVLFQSPANEETVLEKRERMERFGWILRDSSYDSDRNVTRFLYTRDLSLPENQWKKDSEEDAEDALLAQKFAENNIAYCEYRKNETKKPRSHTAIIVIMIAFAVLCAVLACLFRYADILAYGKFETVEELEHFKQTFVYDFPDGKTLFGKTSCTYSELVNFLTLALGGIAAIFLAVIVIMRRSTRKSKLIQESEYRYLEERQEYFEDLAFKMEDLYDELNDLAELSKE